MAKYFGVLVILTLAVLSACSRNQPTEVAIEVIYETEPYVADITNEPTATTIGSLAISPSPTIIQTLPRHQGTNVPTSTGIEFLLPAQATGEDMAYIQEHFTITPTTTGDFIYQYNVVIFKPHSPLADGSIYTITVGDLSLQFETAMPHDLGHISNISIHFPQRYLEFSTTTNPVIPFWLGYDHGRPWPGMEVAIYAFPSLQAGIHAVNTTANLPIWSSLQWLQQGLSTDGLTQAYTTTPPRGAEAIEMQQTLPPGFYLLQATSGDVTAQAVIQITDLAFQVIADNSKTLVWGHDLGTGQPLAGVSILDPRTGEAYVTNNDGLATIPRATAFGDSQYFIIEDTALFIIAEGQQFFHSNFGPHGRVWHWDPFQPTEFRLQGGNVDYFAHLSLDRTLFTPTCTMYVWGFLQPRAAGMATPAYVTATITQHTWGWWDVPRDILHRQEIAVAGGSYSGSIVLPGFAPGMYLLEISAGADIISSINFTIDHYVTPPYQVQLTQDQQAVFAGQEITFTTQVTFFEGTPVPDIPITYHTSAFNLHTPDFNRAQTDANGFFSRTFRPTPHSTTDQGTSFLTFTTETELPEIGWSFTSAHAQVFVNDIEVAPTAHRDGREAQVAVDVHQITLDRLNDGTAANSQDFIGAAVEGQEVHAQVYRIDWRGIPAGTYYDFFTREVRTRYRYVERRQRVTDFVLTTDADGHAAHDFTLPDYDQGRESFQVVLTTIDGNGRTIRHPVFIGQNWTNFFHHADEHQPFLSGGLEAYQIGDSATLAVMQGDQALTQGGFLFVTMAHDRIIDYQIGQNHMDITFDHQHIPNATVLAYYFNGQGYFTGGDMAHRMYFDITTRGLALDVTLCQVSYRPGDTVTITVNTGKPATVNIDLVDTAIFTLMSHPLETLASLYRLTNDRPSVSLASHNVAGMMAMRLQTTWGGLARADVGSGTYMAMAESAPVATSGTPGISFRHNFQDTAWVETLYTGPDGIATFTIVLPDNLTTWRVAVQAITADLYAGSTYVPLAVTMPLFVHYAMGDVFVAGDVPSVGVTAFGTDLTGGMAVSFVVTCPATGQERRGQGQAFQRVNIPLWPMEDLGYHRLIIRTTAAGATDAIEHNFSVIPQYHTLPTVTHYNEVTPATIFALPPSGHTHITFTDHGSGRFVPQLFDLRHRHRNTIRIEHLVASRESTRLLAEHFPDSMANPRAVTFDIAHYQREDGGISILPYGGSNLEATVNLLPFVAMEINRPQAIAYLQSAMAQNPHMAIYGLATLGQPIFEYLQLPPPDNIADATYLGLAFVAAGLVEEAGEVFAAHIRPHMESITPYYRLPSDTALVAVLAAKLDQPQAHGLFAYATSNPQHQTILQRLHFITLNIGEPTENPPAITYRIFGEETTRTLYHGMAHTLNIPVENFDQFELVAVAGQVSATSTTPQEITPTATTDDVTITRRFVGDFDGTSLIRVEITIAFGENALPNQYQVTDFLPAGLTPVSQSSRMSRAAGMHRHHIFAPATLDNRVTFMVHNRPERRQATTFYYYARVVTPGTFYALPPIVQSVTATDYIAMGIGEQVVIGD